MALVSSRSLALVAAALFALGAVGVVKWRAGPEPSNTFNLVIVPGEDPAVVPVDVTAARVVEIDGDGALLVRRGAVVQRYLRPQAYQAIDGTRGAVGLHFEITPAGRVQFAVGAYDPSRPLYISSTASEGRRR